MSIILSPKLKQIQPGYYAHYCPGCKCLHMIPTEQFVCNIPCAKWSFNGNVEKPTFSPSMKISYKNYTCTDEEYDAFVVRINAGEKLEIPGHDIVICHYILTDGIIHFCGDGTHDLTGVSYPLPDLPSYHLEQKEDK